MNLLTQLGNASIAGISVSSRTVAYRCSCSTVRVTGDVKVLPKVDVVNSTGAAGGGPKMFFGAKNARAPGADA